MRISTGLVAAAIVGTVAFLVTPGGEPKLSEPITSTRASCVAAPAMVCDARIISVRGAASYRRVEVAAQTCTVEKLIDGGVESAITETVPAKPRADVEVIQGSCVPASSVTATRLVDAGVSFVAQACACRKPSGVCQYRDASGTLVAAPLGKTLGPGYSPFETWAGAGCEPKSCVELAGETSWPSACPRR